MKSLRRCATHRGATLLILASAALAGCVIDRSIQVEAGEKRGATRIIDGDLVVAANGQVASARIIDGNLTVQENGKVMGATNIVDGELTMQPGSVIGGDLTAHHAELSVDGARIDGDVELFCTRGHLTDTRIPATVHVRRRALWHVDCDSPGTLLIGAGSEIGHLVVESSDVEVRVNGDARIGKTEGPVAPEK